MSTHRQGRSVKVNQAFVEGEEVMGKWPGSYLWYEAVVASLDYGKNTFVLRFSDGQENEVPLSHISKKNRFRSRSRSASPSRKPRRSRSKSPSRRKRSPRKPSPARVKAVPSQRIVTSEDYDEKPPVSPGTVTVKSKTRVSKTPPRTAVGQQLEARVTRSTLRELEKKGADTEGLRESLGKGLNEQKSSSKKRPYEFGGPFGVVFMMLTLPLFVYASYIYCNKKCWHLSEIFKKHKVPLPSLKEFFDPEAAAIVYGWVAFQVFLSLLPLGKVVEGMPLKDNTRLKYRLNGFYALVISILGFAACIYYKLPVANLIYSKFLGMITHALIMSFILSVVLFAKAYVEKSGFSETGNSGNPFYDFFMGKQLNPRIFNFDFKLFFDFRPGIIGLVLIDFAMAHKLYQDTNTYNAAILLVCLFHLIYVGDGLLLEGTFFTTAEIKREGFGFMLAFGDLVFVPFLFSLQARFLVDHPCQLSPWMTALLLLINAVGFIIYRISNLQKDRFRHDPGHPVAEHLDSMATIVPGRRLLISGWWGYVRHPNYLGDIIMSVAWSLTCGFTHIIPYIYPLYVTIMLIHRCFRVEADCRLRYGRSWDEYCKRVPYRLFPNIF